MSSTATKPSSSASPTHAHEAPAPGFGGLPEEFRNPKTAQIAVLPVPYDLTSTWQKGADRGPAALISASANMELFDIPTGTEVYRKGICTLDPVQFNGTPDKLADKVQAVVTGILKSKQFPVLLGGEHSVSIGAFRAVASAFPKGQLSILQIDAHGDTREEYHGSPCNHACVMARARELCPITQVGIRAIDVEETHKLDPSRVFFGHQIAGNPDHSWMDKVIAQQSPNVYVTIDLDAFDPAFVPATGTPEPGGLSWNEVNTLLEKLVKQRNVIGFDVVELLPMSGQWASEFFAAKLVYRFLSMIFAQRR
ncbi:MAG TPA: agmatinase [Phycisphaerales bacterium]|nr:agmatinase [Phycisphaerales bacterium]